MKKIRSLAAVAMLVLGMSILCGSCGVGGCGRMLNTEGDGIAPTTTLTSFVLGYDRYQHCTKWDRTWECDSGRVVPSAPWNVDTIVTRNIAWWMPWPFEWVIGFLLFVLSGVVAPQDRTHE